MWGLKTSNERRDTAKHIYMLAVDKEISREFNPPSKLNYKGGDQDFLAKYVFDLIAQSSMIHDSYCCNGAYSGNTSPWPSRRLGNCFVGSPVFCNETAEKFQYECPVLCRPKEHIDWIYC